MKKITVINRETKEATSWEAKNIKSFCDPKTIEAMRKEEKHELFSFIIEFKELSYGMGMWEVDKYDLIVE